MSNGTVPAWHEQDQYWEAVADEVFSPARRARAASDVDCAVALVSLAPGAQVLDMACGVGLHSLELARRGYQVTGVDRTRSFVERARLEAQATGLAVEFVCADMREFLRPEAFAAAFSLFTSFGYFEDPRDERIVAQNLRRSLRPDGSILIDTDGREVFERGFTPRVHHEELEPVVTEERELSADHHWVRAVVTRGSLEQELRYSYRLYSERELAVLLRTAGFASVRAFGSLDGRPYDAGAQRLVIVARRPSAQFCA